MNATARGAAVDHRPLAGIDLVSALGVVVIWGINFVAMKYSLREFTPFQLGALRFVFAALPLVLFLRRPRMPARWLVGYGLSQGVGQFGFLFVALQAGMSAALASVLLQTQVFFTTLLGALLLHERIGAPLRIGLALAAIGLACFGVQVAGGVGGSAGGSEGGGVTAAGLLLTLAAAAMWSVSNIIARRAQQAHPEDEPLNFVAWSSLAPILPFAAMSLLFDPPAARSQWLHAGAGAWAGVLYLGWIATALGYGLWTGLFKRHPANRVAPFSLGVPLVGLAAGMGLLGERISHWQWAGIAFVVAALVAVIFGGHWAERGRKRRNAGAPSA